MVEKDYVPIQLPVKSKPFELVGCVPQVIKKHDAYRKSYRFVSIDDY